MRPTLACTQLSRSLPLPDLLLFFEVRGQLYPLIPPSREKRERSAEAPAMYAACMHTPYVRLRNCGENVGHQDDTVRSVERRKEKIHFKNLSRRLR